MIKPVLSTAIAALVLTACASTPFDVATVMPAVETGAMPDAGDTADDPAIWLNAADPAASRVLGTNKDTGLYVYDLEGNTLQTLLIGQLNNVDLRIMDGGDVDIAVASNDSVGAASIFTIEKASGAVSHLGDMPVSQIEPYGICLGHAGDGLRIGITYKDGTFESWIPSLTDGGITGQIERTASVRSQPEGCVFDEVHNAVFVGEEGRGLWRLDLSDPNASFAPVDMISDRNGLAADVEGVSMWRGADGAGWIVVSAQARDRFVVYERAAPHTPRGIFSIGEDASAGIDAVTHTDGLDVVSGALPGYPRGLVVVQDDVNAPAGQGQNFKYIDWSLVETALGLEILDAE